MIYRQESLGRLLVSGWSHYEETGFWSIAPNAVMIIPLNAPQKSVQVQLICEPFVYGETLKSQSVQIFCNGLLAISTNLKRSQVLYFEMNTGSPMVSGLKLNYIFANAIAPAAIEAGADQRTLAIKINEVTIL